MVGWLVKRKIIILWFALVWNVSWSCSASSIPMGYPLSASNPSAHGAWLEKTHVCLPYTNLGLSCWIGFSSEAGKGVGGREVEHVLFLLGKCLFSWLANPFFPSPFDIILMVPLEYIQRSLASLSASALCHLVNGRQVLSSEKQRTG